MRKYNLPVNAAGPGTSVPICPGLWNMTVMVSGSSQSSGSIQGMIADPPVPSGSVGTIPSGSAQWFTLATYNSNPTGSLFSLPVGLCVDMIRHNTVSTVISGTLRVTLLGLEER